MSTSEAAPQLGAAPGAPTGATAAAAPPAPATAAATRADARRAPRVAALDVVRGLMLVASVVTSSLLAPPEWFEHAPWDGVHPLDLVFPTFVTLSGAGLALAHRRGVRVRRLVRRVVVLLLAGLAYNASLAWLATGELDLAALRWTGVLQLYAAVVLVVALGHLLTRRWQGWLAIALGLAAAHTALLVAWARGCPGGALTPECNPSGGIDGAVLPAAHLYASLSAGHDPEGLVGILGACATAAAGAAAAHALLAARSAAAAGPAGRTGRAGRAGRPVAALPRLLLVAAVLAAAAAATSPLVPTMKRLWTAPFGLSVAAGTVVVLAVVHLLVDGVRPGRAVRALRWPFVALGRNSLLVYFGSHVVVAALVLLPRGAPDPATGSAAGRLAGAVAVAGSPQLGLSLVLLAAWWALAAVLHVRRWYVRA